MRMIMHIIVVMNMSVMMHTIAYYSYGYDAYYNAYFCRYAYYCYAEY